jgi:hypothetical protein
MILPGLRNPGLSGGLAVAIPLGPGVPYNYNNNGTPTVGGRFTFKADMSPLQV